MAALLTSVADDKDKSALYLSECRRMGIKVLPPDVNESVATFAAVGHGHQVRPGGDPQRGRATWWRRSSRHASPRAHFTGFTDFLRKVPLVVCNKRVIESLIKAGAFDSFGDARKGLVLVHEQAVDAVIDIKRNEAIGQDSLFGGDAEAEAVFDVPVPDRGVGQVDAAELRAGDARAVRLGPPAVRHRAHHRPGKRLRTGRSDRRRHRGAAAHGGPVGRARSSRWAASCPASSAR